MRGAALQFVQNLDALRGGDRFQFFRRAKIRGNLSTVGNKPRLVRPPSFKKERFSPRRRRILSRFAAPAFFSCSPLAVRCFSGSGA